MLQPFNVRRVMVRPGLPDSEPYKAFAAVALAPAIMLTLEETQE
jgi:hypothetical protein